MGVRCGEIPKNLTTKYSDHSDIPGSNDSNVTKKIWIKMRLCKNSVSLAVVLLVFFASQVAAQSEANSKEPIRSVLAEQGQIAEPTGPDLSDEEPSIDELTRPHTLNVQPSPAEAKPILANPISKNAKHVRNQPADREAEPPLEIPPNKPREIPSPQPGDEQPPWPDTKMVSEGNGDALGKPQTPHLSVHTGAPRASTVNQTMHVKITVTNHGSVIAPQAVLQIDVNRSGRILKTTPRESRIDEGIWEFNLDNIEAGETRVFEVNVVPVGTQPIAFHSRVIYATSSEVSIPVHRPELELEVGGIEKAEIGSVLVNRVVVRNSGMGPIRNLVVTQACRSPSVKLGSSQRQQTIAQLMPGESKEVKFLGEAISAGTATFQFHAKSPVVSGRTQRHIQIAMESPQMACGGPEIPTAGVPETFGVRITNPGKSSMTNMTLVCQLPNDFRIAVLDRYAEYREAERSYRWTLAELKPGQSELIQFRGIAEVRTLGSLKFGLEQSGIQIASCDHQIVGTKDSRIRANNASISKPISMDETDGVRAAIATETTLGLEIQQPAEPIQVGKTVTMIVRVHNSGSALAEDVKVTLDLPGKIGVYRSKDYRLEGNRIVCHTFNLPAEHYRDVKVQFIGGRAGEQKILTAVQSSSTPNPVSESTTIRIR